MKLLKGYIRKIWKTMILPGSFVLMWAVLVFLYDLPAETVLYGAIFILLMGIAVFLTGLYFYRKKYLFLSGIRDNLVSDIDLLPYPADEIEGIYQEMLCELNSRRMKAEASKAQYHQELTDYYTMWVHQIKTPIAAMRLILQEGGGDSAEVSGELFRIEQYVEMVLGYLRTEDMSADMSFCDCSLDKIIREQIHKYAHIFIGKKLALEYEGTDRRVLTDPKWLGFVIGQILSNSLKYTKNGRISIYLSETRPDTLIIRDTGTGVQPEDIPRVFERGFTGCNGRENSRSTGIGLYLSAKIMKKLGHKIYMESEPGEGTSVYLVLGRPVTEIFS